MINPREIDHVTLFVRSSSEAKAYYERTFGFRCEPWHGDSSVLLVESAAVHFFIVEDKNAPQGVLDRQHISFAVDDLEAVETVLRRHGERTTRGQFDGFQSRNFRWVEWRDPSGIRLECVQRLPTPDAAASSETMSSKVSRSSR